MELEIFITTAWGTTEKKSFQWEDNLDSIKKICRFFLEINEGKYTKITFFYKNSKYTIK